MVRRARYQFGRTLPRGPEGEITSGLGPGTSVGTISLFAPTDIVSRTGQEMTIDGVTLSFQVTPGTEAPAEMNFYLPQFRAVFMAENANATLDNLLFCLCFGNEGYVEEKNCLRSMGCRQVDAKTHKFLCFILMISVGR
jgi:alkyl sulfatase BDS1-like metallo-beta-lactamase superfamily hydrolase